MSVLPFVILLGCTTALPLQAIDANSADEAAAPLSAADQLPHPTLAEIFSPPNLLGRRPTGAALSANGHWAIYRWAAVEPTDDNPDETANDNTDDSADESTDEPEPDWWLASTTTGKRRVLFAHDDDVSLQWAAEDALLIVQQDGWLDTLDVAGEGSRRPLFEAQGGASLQPIPDRQLLLSTHGDHVLWLIALDSGHRRRLSDGWLRFDDHFDWQQDAGKVSFFARADPAADDEEPGTDALGMAAGHSGGSDESQHGAHGVADTLVAIDTFADIAVDASAQAAGETSGPQLVLVAVGDDVPDVALDIAPGPTATLSPDGRWVALTRVEWSFEHELIMADYLTEQVTTVPVRGSLAGDPATAGSVSIYDIAAGESFVPPLDEAQRYAFRRTAWSPDGALLLVDRISEDSHVRQVLIVDPATREAWPVFSDRDEAWIGAPTVWSGWSQDSSAVLLTSERSGFNHLYRVDAHSGEAVALTSGPWEIQRVTPIDGDERLLLTAHPPGDPASMQLQLVDGRSGAEQRLVGAGAWADRPQLSADGGTLLYRFATLGQPWDLYALTVGSDLIADDKPVRLSDTVPKALGALDLPLPELISYRNPDDGVLVHAYLYKPEPFDPNRRYPAVMFIHGAGQLQQVRRSMSAYASNMLFHHRLARQGFVVIDPDYRHSNGYGRDFRAAIHGYMGGKDLDDVVAGIDYLETLGYVDTDKVGIYGGSYGGFMVLMALFTRPEAFAAGAALRSVTDWRTYNHWYTNPRLGLPDEDPEAYERSSPIDHVEGLQEPLLLLHGLKDDNVFAQDSIRLMEKMIELGKDFEVMLYPSQGHGFTDPASWIDEYKRIERLFLRELRD